MNAGRVNEIASMPLNVYGDMTVDNYEYFGKFSEAYEELFNDLSLANGPPGMSGEATHRIVARALGGSFLLARFASIALSLWRSKNPTQHPDCREEWFRRLDELEPWSTDGEQLHDLNSDIIKDPGKYDGLLRLHYRLKRSSHDKCYRVEPGGMEGYTLPAVYRPRDYLNSQALYDSLFNGSRGIPVDGSRRSRRHVMLFNDGGLRYRKDPDDWLDAEIKALGAANVWAVIKARDPATKKNDATNWPFIRFLTRLNSKGIRDKTIVCLDADYLRALGVEIARSLSWEKSLKDLVSNIQNGKVLPGHLPAHLVVTFDYDAVVYFRIGGKPGRPIVDSGTFIFSKNSSEGEFSARVDGKMPGAQSLFVSVLSALLYEWHENAPDKAAEPPFETLIGYGLLAKRRMLECGFSPLDAKGIITTEEDSSAAEKNYWLIPKIYYQEAVFALQELRGGNDHWIKTVPIAFKESEQERPSFRSPIADEATARERQFKTDLSQRDLVIFPFKSDFFAGKAEVFQYLAARSGFGNKTFVNYVLNDNVNLPLCTMGRLKTIAREEIEGLRTIRRLAENYLENNGPNEKPIGIAVFGPPGAGKSFAVKTVFGTLPKACKDLIEDAFLECNLSGLEQPEDIAEVFQFARDKRLRGKVPVLFFDEFDCSVKGERYFWLKHFLAPLQDGEFIAGHTKRPIGKSIFVFAGGTKHTYAEFEHEVEPEFAGTKPSAKAGKGGKNGKRKGDEPKTPVMKGRDFLSRLQAHLDIMGLEPDAGALKGRSEPERRSHILPYTMRKAILLRGALDQWVPQIFDSRKRARMDEELVEQFLTVWRYKHGVRSIEAIIRMSALGDEVRFSKSCLPPEAQLFMHIHKDSYRPF